MNSSRTKGEDKNNEKGDEKIQLSIFQPKPKRNPDGTFSQIIIPKVAQNQFLSHTIKCLAPKCQKTFKTKQGLGSHLNSCIYYKEDQLQVYQKNSSITNNSTIYTLLPTNMVLVDATGREVTDTKQ